MSRTHEIALAERAVTLAELRAYYADLAVTFVSGHDKSSRRGPARATAYDQAKRALASLDQLIEDHDNLTRAVREATR